MKRLFIVSVTAVLLILGLSASSWAVGKVMKLHIAHWNVPKDPNTNVLKAIAKDIEEASGGMITTEISWQALGKPGDYYNAVVKGLCDIVLFGPSYTPGRFLISEMLTLPIHYPSNEITVRGYYHMWKNGYLDKEFSAIVPIAVGNSAPSLFMWRDKPVTKLSELKGKKVSAPFTTHSQMMERAGATPVSMPVTETYMALETGVLDGCWQIWPAMPIFKLMEVVKYVTDVSMSAGPFVIAANKDIYKRLPERVKSVLEQNQEKYSLMMAAEFQGFSDLGKKLFLDSGGTIQKLSEEDTTKLHELFRPIFADWVKKTQERGLPAEKALDELYHALIKLGVGQPFIKWQVK